MFDPRDYMNVEDKNEQGALEEERYQADLQAWIDRQPKCDTCGHLVAAKLHDDLIGYCGFALENDRISRVTEKDMCEMHFDKSPEID